MADYKKVDTSLNFAEREKEVVKFWNENHVFEESVKKNEGKEEFSFYDGPPTANGKPHIGHILTRVMKDIIPRYQTMKGKHVLRKAGWDTHGLPVELEVEKKLGFDHKTEIEAYGIEPFIKECKKSVWKYTEEWKEMSDRVGYWCDMDTPYVTYHDDYIESEWWALKTMHEKGLLYKGHKIVPYCPRCGTALSSHEVAQGYKDVKQKTAFVKFRVKGEKNTYILAWTTTPWTLPSNVALCMHPDYEYVRVKMNENGEEYILAEGLLTATLGAAEGVADADGNVSGGYKIIGKKKGREYEHTAYEPLYPFGKDVFKFREEAYYVVNDTYVTLTDGTGVVHIAPAFGEDDYRVGRKYNLPLVQLVDSKGEMTKETPWAGTFCKDADKEILVDLDKRGLLFSAPKFEHSYPHCWRCDTPLIYYARDSWFIKMTDVKEQLIANNNTVNWIPDSIGKGRFGDWLNNVQDWGISRNRYWGTPLNIWECECGHRHSIGSIKELKAMSDNCPDDIELHRPYIDDVTIKCPHCGKQMHRVPEVIDCWFDSGSMPFAQHHYPFENKELFESQFPADFISEAVDQTRGWFYSLLAISTLLFDKAPYKNVIVLGHIQDKDGQKMSKSKGNAVDPFDALQTYGADAIRWYFYTNSNPWLPKRFYGKAVVEGQRKFMGTLWNTYAFFVLYANIDNFDATKYTLDRNSLAVIDKWLLSRLNSTVKAVDSCLSGYKIPEAAKALQSFVDEMSNWYVRRCRERFWAQDMTQDKINAYMTLYTALVTIAKASAPMIPFMAESIYQNLVRSIDNTAPESVHLCLFPTVDEAAIDTKLEADMDEVLKIVVLGRSARNGSAMKNRQPLAKMYVKAQKALDKFYVDIIEDELNIKEVVFTDDVGGFVSYSFKPQLKTLGPKYGKQLGEIRNALANVDGVKAKAELNETGTMTLSISTGDIKLTEDDLLIDVKQMEGLYTVSDNGVTVVLDTTLTPELVEEGFVREIISKVQTMRKDAGFEVMDHIIVGVSGNDKIADIMSKNKAGIANDVLANDIVNTTDGFVKDWNINGEKVVLSVSKVD